MSKKTKAKPEANTLNVPPARNDAESADLIARLDKLTSESDTSQNANIQDYQIKHAAYMQQNYGRYVDQFEMFFSAIADYSYNVNYLDKKAWPKSRGLQFIIATRSLKQLYSAHKLLLDGVYEDAIALLRSSYESFLRVVFISCNPNHSANAYKYPGQKGVQFIATNFVKDELELDWSTYEIANIFTHSNMYIVMGDVATIAKGQAEAINLDYKLDKDMIEMVINLIDFLLDIFLSAYDQLFTVDISKYKSKDEIQVHIDRLHEYASICHELLSGNTNANWRKTAVDIEHIFKLINTMDNDQGLMWKDEWSKIRTS